MLRIDNEYRNIPRGLEIDEWLNIAVRKYYPVFKYCILDDCSDMLLEQRHHFVETKFSKGLTKQKVLKILKVYDKISY